jgi:serine/threonine-protein kinase
MLPVLAAIAVAHEEGVIHRDLKPSNVFLANGRDGEVVPKVVDFGISKIVSDDLSASLTGSGSLLGTPYYMSPEQAKGEKAIDARTDLYSLGVILYEMVTGKRPFKADSTYNLLTEIVQGRVEAPRALRPELSEAIERVILKAMARARDDRYPSVRDFGRALLPFAGARARVQWSPTFGDRGELEEESPEQQPEAALREPGVGPALTIGGRESIRVPRRPSTLLFAAGGVFLIAAAVLVFALFPRSNRVQVVAPEPEPPPIEKPPPVEEPQNPGTYTVAVEVDPKAAAFLLDGEPAGNGSFRRELPKDGREHTLIVSLEGYDQTRIVFRDSPVVQLVRLNPLPGAAKKPTPPPKKTKTRQGANEAPITD